MEDFRYIDHEPVIFLWKFDFWYLGPRNNRIARFTDESSLSAIYGATLVEQSININSNRGSEVCIFYSPRSEWLKNFNYRYSKFLI